MNLSTQTIQGEMTETNAVNQEASSPAEDIHTASFSAAIY